MSPQGSSDRAQKKVAVFFGEQNPLATVSGQYFIYADASYDIYLQYIRYICLSLDTILWGKVTYGDKLEKHRQWFLDCTQGEREFVVGDFGKKTIYWQLAKVLAKVYYSTSLFYVLIKLRI